MHRLEMPQALAGPSVERDQTVAEQIRPDAVGAIVIVSRRADRQVDDATFLIDAHLTPDIDAADVFVGVLWPGVVAKLAGLRNRVKHPFQFTRNDVVGADVAR